MSHLLTTTLLLVLTSAHAQVSESRRFLDDVLKKGEILPRELNDSLIGKDFGPLWTGTPNWAIYGFIGDDYQRLRVKFISVIREPSYPAVYRVYGKDMVKNNICEFQGEITITNIRQYDDSSYGLDEAWRDSAIQGRFLVCGRYELLEDPSQKQAGLFIGWFASFFYIDRTGAVRYDDIDDVADGYTNNQFVGEWSSYDGKFRKRCNWGDDRIPNSGDLDMGAGDFSPAEEFSSKGWENISLSYQIGPAGDRARAAEREIWWK